MKHQTWFSQRSSGPLDLRLVLLDRDGVINEKLEEGRYVCRAQDLKVIAGAAEAIGMLNQAAIPVVVLTNQRGIALGLYSEKDLEQIHQVLQERLREKGAHIDAFYFCPHDIDQCDCRKPRTGLLRRAFADFPTALPSDSVFIGDSLSDIQAGHAFGVDTIFVAGDPASRKQGAEEAASLADATADSLFEVVSFLFSV